MPRSMGDRRVTSRAPSVPRSSPSRPTSARRQSARRSPGGLGASAPRATCCSPTRARSTVRRRSPRRETGRATPRSWRPTCTHRRTPRCSAPPPRPAPRGSERKRGRGARVSPLALRPAYCLTKAALHPLTLKVCAASLGRRACVWSTSFPRRSTPTSAPRGGSTTRAHRSTCSPTMRWSSARRARSRPATASRSAARNASHAALDALYAAMNRGALTHDGTVDRGALRGRRAHRVTARGAMLACAARGPNDGIPRGPVAPWMAFK